MSRNRPQWTDRLAAMLGRGREGPELTLLRRQGLATVAVPGTEPGTASAHPAGMALGKPRYAKLLRCLPLRSDADPVAVLDEALRLGRDDGWLVPADPPTVGSWVLDKTVGHARLQAGISIQDIDGRRTLVVNLSNYG